MAGSDIVAGVLRRAEHVLTFSDPAGRRTASEMLSILRDADRTLGRRLTSESRRFGGMEARFTGAQALAYRQQVRVVTRYVEARLSGLTTEQAQRMVGRGVRDTIRTLDAFEQRFRSAAPLNLDPIQVLASARESLSGSLLRHHETSFNRYGEAMVRDIERTMAIGMSAGLSQEEVIASVSSRIGNARRVVTRGRVETFPEGETPRAGLFEQRDWWAERIVRTESAFAYNAAKFESLRAARAQDPSIRKKILAVLDSRTAPDSLAVHGQIRRLDEPFVDGAGRVYMMPPARPNDRETVIAWKEGWTESGTSRELTAGEITTRTTEYEAFESRRASVRRRRNAAIERRGKRS